MSLIDKKVNENTIPLYSKEPIYFYGAEDVRKAVLDLIDSLDDESNVDTKDGVREKIRIFFGDFENE